MILRIPGVCCTLYCQCESDKRAPNMPPYLLGIQHKNTACYVCRPVHKRHRHANTQYMYERTAKLGVAPDCSMCLDPDHPKQTTGRIKLVSTSSTLHHVQYCATYQEELIAAHLDFLDSTFHVDIDQIAGGRLEDFIRSWKKWYWGQALPVDCAAVVGLNDVASQGSYVWADGSSLGAVLEWRQ